MCSSSPVVFLLDVDNTLLDNDRVTSDFQRHLMKAFGPEREQRYWTIFEQRRSELGYTDYLGALQQYRMENPHDPQFLQTSFYLFEYPFAQRLYPRSLDAIEHLAAWGPTVIVSDGDVIFQPRKVQRSGLYDAVEGRVLIFVHKEEQLEDVERQYPAEHYVMVDDKLRILTAMKKQWGNRVTTVFPRQGHYARDAKILAMYPAADISLEQIGELMDFDLPKLISAGGNRAAGPGCRA